MSKFKHYKCDTCAKETDLNNDLTHAFIDKCTLTSGCSGRLRFIKEKNTKDLIISNLSNSSQVSLLQKYTKQDLPEDINPCGSSTNEMFIAIKGDFSPNSNASIMFHEILAKEVEFSEYVFNLNIPVSTISGKDSSAQQKILTFDASSEITIFINGQEVDSTKYIAENNILQFNDIITYTTYGSSTVFVKVIVNSKSEQITKSISFDRNVQNRSSGSWNNVDKVLIDNEVYSVFVCDEYFSLDLNSRLNVYSLTVNEYVIDKSLAVILLSAEPFTVADRIYTKIINLSSLDSSTKHLKFVLKDQQEQLLVSSLALQDIYPVISIVNSFDKSKELALTTSKIGSDVSINSQITNNNKYVLGPI